MKELFENPQLEIYSFETADVITVSQPNQDLPEDEF